MPNGWRQLFSTHNNYTEAEYEHLITKMTSLHTQGKLRYGAIGKHIGKKSKLPHIHVIMHLTEKKTVNGWNLIFGHDKAHHEKQKGTHRQGLEYLGKDSDIYGDPWQIGDINVTQTSAATKTMKDLRLELRTHIMEKPFDAEWILQEDYLPLMREEKAFESIRAKAMEKAIPKWQLPTVICYYGKTGLGKTRTAVAKATAINDALGLATIPMALTGSRDYFDWYDGQHAVVFDEFADDQMKIERFLQLTDGYAIQLDARYKKKLKNWTHVFITSQHHPQNWWPNASIEKKAALMRRFGNTPEIQAAHIINIEHPPEGSEWVGWD